MPNHVLDSSLGNCSTLDATPNPRFHRSSLNSALDHPSSRFSAPLRSAAIQTTQGKLVAGISPTPNADLVYNGGKTIANLQYANLYVGGSQSWYSNDIQSIDASLNAAMTDSTLNNILSQYFNNQPITSKFLGSAVLPGSTPDTISQNDLEAYISSLDRAGSLHGFDLNSTVFNFMLPSGTVLSQSNSDSLDGLGGYHGSVHVSANGKVDTVYYAVGAYSETFANGTQNGIPAFNQPWKNVVATLYHELAEVRTDPDVEDANATGNNRYAGWLSRQGEECGDFPVDEGGSSVFLEVPLANGKGTVPIQLQYSNRIHGPENPYSTQVVARSLPAIATPAGHARTAQVDLSEFAPRSQNVDQKRDFLEGESFEG